MDANSSLQLTANVFVRSQEVCDKSYPTYSGDLIMCPVCDADCGYWFLNASCLSAQVDCLVAFFDCMLQNR